MNTNNQALYPLLDQWIDQHFDEEIEFLQSLVQIPTDTPPGNNTPHAQHTASKLRDMGFKPELFEVPSEQVHEAGLQSITNVVTRVALDMPGKTLALNAHGDVVPPGEGWTHPPYGAEIEDGVLYGRASAVSKSDFATFTYAVLALNALRRSKGLRLAGQLELHFTYDEEFGGLLGPGYLLTQGITKPDWMIAAGFSYQVVTAHNGCLQMEVTVHGKMAHAAIPQSGIDALQGAVHVMNALYACNERYRSVRSTVEGIEHPYLNIGTVVGGTNTNVVPGKVTFKLDRRMIPEEDAQVVENEVLAVIKAAEHEFNHGRNDEGIRVEVKRILLAHSMKPLPGHEQLAQTLQKHGETLFGEPIPALGTPLYTDVRLYGEHGIPGVIYGAGPRTVLESHAKRADERLVLEDLRRATQVVARTLLDLTTPES
ncbi:MAG: Acetylornithine deacetylase [Pseudomonadota bacterium]|jgi:acetylornithine deacetylase/succinyl-diaminopimelate desuccinylase family protein